MSFSFKKLFFLILYNTSLFLILIIGIQNSTNKSKVDFLITNSIQLPLSFIIGTSFISGSVLGSLLPLYINKRK